MTGSILELYVGLVLYLLFLSLVCSLALVCGSRVERQVAAAFLAASVLSNVATVFGNHWHGPNWGVIMVDAVFLVVLLVIARHSTRFWPLWTTASQLAGLLAHVPAILNPKLPKSLYALTQPFWAFPLLASLLIGVLTSRHRTGD